MKRLILTAALLFYGTANAVSLSDIEEFDRKLHGTIQLHQASEYSCNFGSNERCIDAQRESNQIVLMRKMKSEFDQARKQDKEAFFAFASNFRQVEDLYYSMNQFPQFQVEFSERRAEIKAEELRVAQEKEAEIEAKKQAEIEAKAKAKELDLAWRKEAEERRERDATLRKWGHLVLLVVCVVMYMIWGWRAFYGPYAMVTERVKDIFDVGVTYNKAKMSGYQRYRTSSLDKSTGQLKEGIFFVLVAYTSVTGVYFLIYWISINSPIYVLNAIN